MSAIAKLRRSSGFVSFVVATAVFTDTLLYSIVIPMLPSFLHDRLNTKREDVQNITSVLLASYGGAILFSSVIVGTLTDRAKSKKLPFMFGLVLLLGATILFFLVPDLKVIIFARVLQGISAAVVWTSGLTFLNQRSSQAEVGSAMGLVSIGSSVGELIGPVVGGFTYDRIGYRGLFTVAMCIITVDIILRLMLSDEEQDESGHSNESRGRDNGRETESLLASADNDSNKKGSENESNRKSSIRLLLGNPDFLASITAMLIVGIMRCGLEATLPIYAEKTFGWHATESGLALLILVIPSVTSPLFGKLAGKIGAHWPSAIALASTAGLYVALGVRPGGDGISGIIIFCICVFGIGTGFFACQTANMVAVATISAEVGSGSLSDGNNQENSSSGLAFAFMTLSSAGGMFVGTSIAGPVVSRYGWLAFCLVFASIALVSALFSGYRAFRRN